MNNGKVYCRYFFFPVEITLADPITCTGTGNRYVTLQEYVDRTILMQDGAAPYVAKLATGY